MKRRFLIPEVIQTSAMDCGPAALKALFGGFGLYLSYGRLREACQTDVDGTSIDTIESIGRTLGMDLEQRMMPADLLLLPSSQCLPAIVVVRLPDGAPHFVVLWRVHGSFVQIMDPAAGRLWMQRRAFLRSLYIHEQDVPVDAWTEWSQSEAFTAGVAARTRQLGVRSADRTAVRESADRTPVRESADPKPVREPADPRPVRPTYGQDAIAHFDASLRLGNALVDADSLRPGAEAQQFLDACAAEPDQIPAEWYVARTELGSAHSRRTQDRSALRTDVVRIRGAVVVTALGRLPESTREELPASLAAVLREPPPRPWAPVWAAVRAGGWALPAIIGLAILIAAAGTVFEVVLFRGLFDLASRLPQTGHRAAAFAMVIAFAGGLLAFEWPAALGQLRSGRHLELRLRAQFLAKIPRLGDRYFQSRLISDMAFRAHTLQLLRLLPEFAGQFVRLAATLAFTTVAIAWLYPGSAVLACLAVVLSVAVPLSFLPAMIERDLRCREMSGALGRFYLDALRGSRAIRAHGAERTLRAAYAPQLGRWADAGFRQHRVMVGAEALQMAVSLAPVMWLVYAAVRSNPSSAGVLLLIYWALSIPVAGRQLASIAWSLPALRNTLVRFLEPITSPEAGIGEAAPVPSAGGVQVDIENVDVVAGGHVVLRDITVHVAAGEHVAIVGASGAGKSSLAGLLLGWHQPQQGRVLVDGEPLTAARLARLRQDTAWIDPQVHVFRASLFDNLRYGSDDDAGIRAMAATDAVDLTGMLQRLPNGLQSSLGEGGALVSGGEGQRVRIARALARHGTRLAILDEPAHGLDRDERAALLATARTRFASATMLAITHDVSDTLGFDRVLVVHGGAVVEDGHPSELAERVGSRYRALLDAERDVQRDLWSGPAWRRLDMTAGLLHERTTRHPRGEVRRWHSA